MATDISLLSPGDQIEFGRFPTGGNSQSFLITGRITVGGVFADMGLITSDDGGTIVRGGDEGFAYRVFEFADGLPKNAPVISWVNADSIIETAAVAGHPGNGVWAYRGEQIDAGALLAIIGPDAHIHAYYEAA